MPQPIDLRTARLVWQLLDETECTVPHIAKSVQVSRKTVYRIIEGSHYWSKIMGKPRRQVHKQMRYCEATKAAIRGMREQRVPIKQICEMLGVSKATVYRT